MVTVNYVHAFDYREFGGPIVHLQVCHPQLSENRIDVDAYLDSGSEKSLFNGFLISSLGITLMNDRMRHYTPTAGKSIEAYLHYVQLRLPGVGDFHLEIGFSNGVIRRNLLGRDFFNFAQIGFRENQLKYYLTPTP